MRTTLDIDSSVLAEAKQLAKSEHKSVGQVISALAAVGLAERRTGERPAFKWISKNMGPFLVNLEDKDAVDAALASGEDDD